MSDKERDMCDFPLGIWEGVPIPRVSEAGVRVGRYTLTCPRCHARFYQFYDTDLYGRTRAIGRHEWGVDIQDE